MTDAPVVVVTGANTGIGRATALELAANGYDTWATMRDLAKGESLLAKADEAGVTVRTAVLDTTDGATIDAAVARILDEAGRIDVWVNNAGVGSITSTEDTDLDAARAVFETNVFGAWHAIQQVLPHFRARGSGTIVQVSSVVGRYAIPGQPAYCASKWALEGLSECLAGEIAPLGLRVRIIEPGVTRTAILAKNTDVPADTAYGDVYARMFDLYAAGIAANVRPEEVAVTIRAAIECTDDTLRWPCAFAGPELTGRRPHLADEEFLALARLAPDPEAYRARFAELFDVPLG